MHLSSVQDTRQVKAMQIDPGAVEPLTCPYMMYKSIAQLGTTAVAGTYTASWVVMMMMQAHNALKCSTILVLEHQITILRIDV